jgi:regulatory protein
VADRAFNPTDLRAYAMRLLAQRDYAVHELHGKLCAKWPGEAGIHELADQLTAELVSEGSLSDQRFAESLVRSRLQRSQGPVKIRGELRQHKLASELVDAVLDQDANSWVEIASAWLNRQHPGSLTFEDRGRYYRRLLNRGFSHDQAMRALEQHNPA